MSQDRIRALEQIIEQQNRERNELLDRAKKAEDMARILQQIIEHQNRQGAIGEAVAITRDGRVYRGSAMPYKYPRLSKASGFFFHKFWFPILWLLERHRTNARSK